MKARDILDHFLSRADWVDPEGTVDRIILGDPDREIGRALVTWIASFEALREARRRGVEMLVTHEPTFWQHRNEQERMDDTELARRKRRFVEESGLVVLRLHDTWDRWPEIGIPWAWARFLGLGERPSATANRNAQHRYDIEPVTVDELARRVASRTATIGEPQVQVAGDGSTEVSKVGIGTGCICKPDVAVEMGCDVSIVCDDGTSYWGHIQRAADADHPVIRVNHGTSEEPGMVTLARYIDGNLAGVTPEHLAHRACYRLARGE